MLNKRTRTSANLENSVQRQRLEVDEHVDDVGPEHLQLVGSLVAGRSDERLGFVVVATDHHVTGHASHRTLLH